LALKESYRILSDNGILLVSVPFFIADEYTVRRAEFSNGTIKHKEPAVYHQNPLSQEGALVFYDLGWDFIEMLKQTGFQDAFLLDYYNLNNGHIGDGIQHIIVAEK